MNIARLMSSSSFGDPPSAIETIETYHGEARSGKVILARRGRSRRLLTMMKFRMRTAAAALAALSWALGGSGCGVEGQDPSGDADADGDTDADAGPDSGADGDSDADSDADGDADDCSEDAKLVYVVDANNGFWRFNPETPDDQPFELVATLDCPSEGSPFSMAISRKDKAYVLYWGGGGTTSCVGINQVNIHTGECEGLVGYECGQYGFDTFGMGFATDGPDTTAETLYVGESSLDGMGGQLASIDTETWLLTPIGPISDSPELTGNQSGELWAYYAWADEPRVVQLDKTTGFESDQAYLPSEISGAAAFAFAYWGGDFYLFHAPTEESTTVYRLHEGAFEEWVPSAEVGFQVVGAGVSTCAPVVVE
jgi:hypothetical protein